jgi:DNA-binding response OmpR family regulator
VRILIVEDEKSLAAILKQGLQENGFVVETTSDGEEGLYMAETYPFDAVLLDVMLPSVDGITILETLRKKKVAVPVLMVTARGRMEDRIRSLNIGADDYIVKPFDFEELVARLKAVIRRSKDKPSPLITVSDLVIDTNSRTVIRAGGVVKLSATEYNILQYLALNSGRVVSRSELIEHVYDTDFDRDSNVIDVYVNYLRNKLDKDFSSKLIRTVRGAGYVLGEAV